MTSLPEKYQRHDINHGVSLKRFFISSNLESVDAELGSVEFWSGKINELYSRLPFRELWEGVTLNVINNSHPDLELLKSQGVVTVKDFDLNTPGNQTAVGLYWGNDSKRMDVNIFPERGFFWSANVLSHEFGHMIQDLSGIFEDKDDIQKLMTQWFRENRPHQAAGDNEHEDFAEVFRALCGFKVHQNKFSDDKVYDPPKGMKTLVRCCYNLAKILKNKKITDLNFHDWWCQWREWERVLWFIWVPKDKAMTDQWDTFTWNGSSWVKD